MKFFRKHQKKIIAVLALFLAALMILPMITMIMGSAGAVTQAEIDKLKENAASLAQQKRTLNSQLDSIEGEIDNALAKKRVVEQEIMVVEEQIVNSEAQITMYDEKIAQEEINLANAQEEETLHYENFCRRVRIMEEQGSTSYWQILFNAADFTDLLDRIIMINEVVEYDHAVMDALELARVNVEQAKATLENARAEQVSVKEALNAQNAELVAKRNTIDSLLAEMESKKDTYESKIHELDSQAEAMDAEIEKKQKELEKQIAASKIQFNTGSGYVWPVDGCYVITSFFGPRIHPITGKAGNHTGTDVRASYGTPIKAARGGVVITSAYHWSYGNYVVVSHGNNESTLYAHMSKRAVSEGKIVSQGQVLGYVGSTGSSTGNHLHYEVRIGGVRQDALNYYPAMNFWYVYGGNVYPYER